METFLNACSVVVLRASELVDLAEIETIVSDVTDHRNDNCDGGHLSGAQPFNLGRLMIKRLPALSYESAQTDLSSGLRFVAGLEPFGSFLHGAVEQAVCRSSADRKTLPEHIASRRVRVLRSNSRATCVTTPQLLKILFAENRNVRPALMILSQFHI